MKIKTDRLEKIKNALERTISYRDATKIACVSSPTVIHYAKKLGYPNSYELRAMWKFFDYISHREYVLNRLLESDKKLLEEAFKCPFDYFRARSVRRAILHLMKNHYDFWKRIEIELFEKVKNHEKCIMVARDPNEYTKDDFLFEAIERSWDPNSLFSDEEFVIKLFGGMKKIIKLKNEDTLA